MNDPQADSPRDLDADARHALELAVDETVELGHDRLGTEHLLLGLIAHERSRAGRVLADAGVTLAAARHKVAEATGPRASRSAASTGAARTPRAGRALSRAVRFSHARRSEVVSTQDVLLGVLDVEGTAGQVLRRLGVDLDRLRATLAADTDAVQVEPPAVAAHAAPSTAGATDERVVCPSCRADLRDDLVVRELTARGPGYITRTIDALTCGHCAVLLGVVSR